MTNGADSWPRRALPFGIAVALALVAIARDSWPWIADDAFISLRYAENLLAGHGLCWNPGERVEGYSNLSWVLSSAVLMALGVDPITAVRALALASSAATLLLLAFGRLLPARWPGPLALPLLAAQASFGFWAIGGLETPLVMLLVGVVMLGLERAWADAGAASPRWLWCAGGALALLTWTRPDGPLWAVIAAVVVVWQQRRTRRFGLLLPLLLPPVLAFVAQLTFRLAWYGDWIPNTGRAKVSPLAICLEGGWHYLLSAAVSLRSLLLPALLGALLGWRLRGLRPALLFAIVGVAVWSLYTLRVGGDVFPRNRFFAVVFAPLCVLAAHGFAALARFGRLGSAVAWLLALAAIGTARYDAERPTTDVRQQPSTWEWNAIAIGQWLGQAFGDERPLLAIDAAGAVPFYSGLPCVDMLGLNDATIAKTPLSPERGFVVGHNRGNGPYVLARQPDLVVFNIPGVDAVPHWKSGVEMIADPTFFADYRLVLFEDRGPGRVQLLPWVRVAGRIGAERDGDEVVVPGWLLGSWRQPHPLVDPMPGLVWLRDIGVVGVLDAARDAVVGEVRRAGPHVLRELPLPDGTWRATAEGLPAGAALTVTPVEGGHADVVLEVAEGTSLPFVVHEVALRRAD